MKIGDIVYYAQIMPKVPMFNVIELKIRTINESNLNDKWFVGVEKHTKHAHLFSFNDIYENIFLNRNEALEKVKKEENNCNKKDCGERFYEEY